MPAASSTLPSWAVYAPIFAPIITWFLVIIGWRIVSNDNNEREKRREVRSDLDSIVETINALESKSIKYYITDISDESKMLEVEMKRDMKVLEVQLKRLAASDKYFQELRSQTSGLQGSLQKTLSGGDFEVNTRQKRPHSDGKLIEISSASRDLIDALEMAYITKYTKKPWL